MMESQIHWLILSWLPIIISADLIKNAFTNTALVLNVVLILLLGIVLWNFITVKKKLMNFWNDNEYLRKKNNELMVSLASIKKLEITIPAIKNEKAFEYDTEAEAGNPVYLRESHAANISHVKAEGNYINLKYKERMKYVLVRDRLKNVNNLWHKYHFIQTHKSYLVNMKMINHVNWNMISLSDGSRVPLSRNHKKEFQDAYALFLKKNQMIDAI